MENIKNCPFCSAAIPAGAGKCPNCSRPLAGPSGEPQRFIPVRPVEEIPCDNAVFMWCRKKLFFLDRSLFGGNAGYQPTRFALVLPFWCGIVCALGYFFLSIVGGGHNPAIGKFMLCVPAMLAINLLVCGGNIAAQSGAGRKLLYALFIVASSLIFCAIVMVVFSWYLVIKLFCFFIKLAFNATFSENSSSSSSGSAPQEKVEEMWVDDGSLMGKTLTRKNSSDWYDSCGNRYEDGGDGYMYKK